MSETTKKPMALEKLLEDVLVPEEEQPYQVPMNWEWTNLGCILEEVKNGTNVKQNKEMKGIPVTRIESLQNNSIDFYRIGYIEEENKLKENDFYMAEDIALSHINSIEHVGKTALIESSFLPLIHGVNLLRLRLYKNQVHPKYFQLYTRSYIFKKDVWDRVNRAVNQVSLNQKNLKTIRIPIAPLDEQKRIAEKVERLFAKIDESKQLIKEAKDSINIRQAAIWTQAFTGELTKNWREKNINIESAQKWLDEIKNNKRTMRFKDQLDPSIVEKLFKLPKGWIWVRLNDLIDSSTYGTSAKADDDSTGTPVLRMGNIVDGVIQFNNLKYLPTDHVDVQKLDLQVNDLLFNRTNSYELVGKTALIDDDVAGNATFASYLIRVRLLDQDVLASYVCQYINSHIGRSMLLSMVTQQVGQANINSQKLASLPIPLPPKEEVIKISEHLNYFRELEDKQKSVLELESQIKAIKQAILTKAFRGELGTNNPREENAIDLLKEALKTK